MRTHSNILYNIFTLIAFIAAIVLTVLIIQNIFAIDDEVLNIIKTGYPKDAIVDFLSKVETNLAVIYVLNIALWCMTVYLAVRSRRRITTLMVPVYRYIEPWIGQELRLSDYGRVLIETTPPNVLRRLYTGVQEG